MGMTSADKRVAAWIAAMAVLMAALAPSISHALAARQSDGGAWIEICAAEGSRRIAEPGVPTQDAGSHRSQGFHFEHCLFCLTHAGSFGVPPSSAIAMPIIEGDRVLPSLFFHAPRTLFVWAPAQSRAPPIAS